MTETILLTMTTLIAFGIPGAFVFGRALGREDEKAARFDRQRAWAEFEGEWEPLDDAMRNYGGRR